MENRSNYIADLREQDKNNAIELQLQNETKIKALQERVGQIYQFTHENLITELFSLEQRIQQQEQNLQMIADLQGRIAKLENRLQYYESIITNMDSLSNRIRQLERKLSDLPDVVIGINATVEQRLDWIETALRQLLRNLKK